jgi:hypothetical protein
VRFQFRGFDRETGEPVDGHVEASDTEAGYQVLSDHGIVTETLRPDPRAADGSPETEAIAQFANALESALDLSSSQVAFDELSKRYRGKKVWVVDRNKIRHRVAQVVDSTLAASEADLESGPTARQRVANAISELFADTTNIASQHSAESIAKMRSGAASGDGLAEQIGKLSGVVEQAESLIAAMQAALRNVDSGGAPRRRTLAMPSVLISEQNEVLREILESNLDLRRTIEAGTTQ